MNWDELLITVVDPDSFIVTEDEMIYSLQAEQRMIIFTGERGLDSADGKDGYSVHPAGVWMEGTAYNKLDLVSHDGTSFVARQDVPIGVLTSDERYWMISAEKGDQGPEGPQGPPGYGAEWGNIGGQIENQTDLSAAMLEKADTLIVASNFDASESYAGGDYVVRGGELFRFISDHTGDWDSSHVTAVNVGNELTGKSDIGHDHDDRYYTEAETDALLDDKQDTLAIDSVPTQNSTAVVESGGVYAALVKSFRDVYKVTLPNASSSKKSFTASGITSSHEMVVEGWAYLSNPAAVTSNLSITTGTNSITITGTLTGTTNIIVTLGIPRSLTAS